jgi:hypothetical protein
MQLLRAVDVAKLLKIYSKQLYETEFRKRWNLPAVRVGRSIRFREEDVQRIIDQGLEKFEDKAACGE